MELTQKEKDFLNDFSKEEQLCIDKYERYEKEANDEGLKSLFATLRQNEMAHKQTIDRIMAGENVHFAPAPSAVSQSFSCLPSSCKADERASDAFLCQDALSTEKHVATTYNTGIFEFAQPSLRDVLGHIQKEEQNHGEQLYQYLALNQMYQ